MPSKIKQSGEVSEKSRAAFRVANQRYRHSEKGRAQILEYKKTAAWKEKRRRQRIAYKKRYGVRENNKKKNIYYKKNYNITLETAQRMKANGCEACGNKTDTMHIDHCHETRYVRGVLCSSCNSALGSLGENRKRIEGLLEYLISNCEPIKYLFKDSLGPCAVKPYKMGSKGKKKVAY